MHETFYENTHKMHEKVFSSVVVEHTHPRCSGHKKNQNWYFTPLSMSLQQFTTYIQPHNHMYSAQEHRADVQNNNNKMAQALPFQKCVCACVCMCCVTAAGHSRLNVSVCACVPFAINGKYFVVNGNDFHHAYLRYLMAPACVCVYASVWSNPFVVHTF